jgi:hypothetical protein
MIKLAAIAQRNTRLWLGVLFLTGLLALTGLSGCATPKQSQAWLQTADSTAQFELVQVPFYPNQDYYCGPAALASMMSYQGEAVTPEQLINRLIIPEKQGTLQIELSAVARQAGWLPYVIAGNLAALEEAVLAGYPVLVLQNLGLDTVPRWHYALVVGFDRRAGHWILRSENESRRLTKTGVFERTWARGGYWGMVLADPAQPPSFAQARAWFQRAFDLESVGQVAAAQAAYASGHQRWPEFLPFGLALLNYYYEQQAWSAGDALLAQLWQQHADSAQLWNNKAVWLAAQGCPQLAQQALQCGWQRQPEAPFLVNSAVKLGLADLDQLPPLSFTDCGPLRCRR